jgi:hypothetical protein
MSASLDLNWNSQNAAMQFAVPLFVQFSNFRNYNNHCYCNIEDRWVYYSADRYVRHNNAFYNFIENNETLNISRKQKEIILKMLGNDSMFKLHKEAVKYVLANIPNTAANVEEYDNLANDTEGELIETIVSNILLPNDILLQKIAVRNPVVLENPEAAELLLKNIRWFAMNHIITNALFNKFQSEMSNKKSRYGIPVRKEDETYFAKKIFFKKTLGPKWVGPGSTIARIFENILWYQQDFNPLYKDIDILKFVSLGSRDIDNICCENWKQHLPELLSDDTNYLTTSDKHTINQYAVWIKYILTIQEKYIQDMKKTKEMSHLLKETNKEIKKIDKIINADL